MQFPLAHPMMAEQQQQHVFRWSFAIENHLLSLNIETHTSMNTFFSDACNADATL